MINIDKSKRVKLSEEVCNDLFVEARKNFSSYGELASYLDISRGHLWDYRNCVYTLTQEMFEKLIELAPFNLQRKAMALAEFFPANWGCVKGGHVTYEKHPEIFEEGRTKGLEKIKKIPPSKRLKYPIDLETELSEELCEFIGAFIGDGFTACYGTYWTEFTGHRKSDKSYHEDFLIPLVEELFGLQPRIIEIGNTRRTIFHSKGLYKLLTERFNMPSGKKCFDVKIPQEILEGRQKYIGAVLRGIVDTDGTVFFDKRKCYSNPYPRVQISTSSRGLASQIRETLIEMGFSLYSNERDTDTGGNHFYIEVYGIQQLNKWCEEIGFSNQTKINKIRELAPVAQLVDRS